jgi:molecular chaperone DnaK (HSP70)
VSIVAKVQEFGFMLKAAEPVLRNDMATREEKRRSFAILVDSLSDETFKDKYIGKQLIVMINMKEEICKEFSNSESQIKDILTRLPRMQYHIKEITKAVNKRRKEYKLGA